jgi:NAD(P)-dependent dehydrogenase (short-subunit alcohol dehydrogenase family)
MIWQYAVLDKRAYSWENFMANIVISGAGRGIGLQLTQQYRDRGDNVIALCRQSNEALKALGVQVVEGIDVTSDQSMQSLSKALNDTTIDVLINNAGILSRVPLDNLDFDNIRQQFEVNTLGPLRVTASLLPQLSTGSKIGVVTSRMGSIGDNGSGGHYGYRASKAAANMVTVSLARDLADRGISVAVLHPGMVATEMTGNNGIPAADAAAGLIQRLDELDMSNTGTFWHANGEILPW